MAWRFTATTQYGELLGGGAWLEGATLAWAAVWGRIDTVKSPAQEQWLFSVRGSSGHFGIRRDDDGLWKGRAYAQGLSKFVTGPACVTGEVHHLLLTYQANNATGLNLYVDGVLGGTASTSGQTALALSGTPAVYLGIQGLDLNDGRCTIENLVIGRDRLPTADERSALLWDGWTYHLGLCGPSIRQWPLFEDRLDVSADQSGAGTHFAGSSCHSIQAGGRIGRWADPRSLVGSRGAAAPMAGTGGPPPEAGWTEWPVEGGHPAASIVLSGLTPGAMYELRMKARDAAGNLSLDSVVVTAQARSTYSRHMERRRLTVRRG